MKALVFTFISLLIICQATHASTLEDRKLEAASYMKAADYETAYTIYAALLWEYPDDDDVNFGIAVSARHIGRIYPALMALERLSVKYPRDMQIRKELLIVYLQVNDGLSARREAEILRQNDIDFQGLNEQMPSSFSFLYSGRFAVGVGYDSNANAGLSSNEVLPGLFLLGAEETESPNVYIQGTLNGAYNLASSWWMVGDLNAYYRDNASYDLVNNNDILWLRAALGARYNSSRYLVDLRIKADFTKQGSDTKDQHIFAHGLDGNFIYGLTPDVMLSTRLSVDTRDYNATEEREGIYWSVGEYLRFIIGDSCDINIGGRMLASSTDAPVYDYLGWEASARVLFYVGHFEITPSIAYRQDRYDDKPSFLDLEDREDKQLRAGLSWLWRFHDDWSLDLTYQYTDNSSNSILYEYKQHTVTLTTALSF